ncbi:MAG: Mur ligase family protein [Chloroflexota bacterium]|nr:Mur ligase family protein [Chloroflexota bacterium]
MQLVEIRDLDGPNQFLLQPAIKVAFVATADDRSPDAIAALGARLEPLGVDTDDRESGDWPIGELLMAAAILLHERSGLPEPELTWTPLETTDHVALAFGWEHRRFGLEVGRVLAAVATGEPLDLHPTLDRLGELLATTEADDRPRLLRDADRTRPLIGVTGTNGKTTTTRLIAHMLRSTGRHVGWATTAGVYIDGELVLEGDYTGPQGAWRVFDEPKVDAAILETARGGILLRGLAYESNDVSVFTNVSPDHLGLHGIETEDGLAQVKSVVVRVTRSGGYAVLNADDPRVRGAASGLHASVFWITQEPENPTVLAHLRTGGRALLVRDGVMIEARGSREHPLLEVTAVPITFGGTARHMVENTLCAAAACLALGLPPAEIVAALTSFGTDPDHNAGRLHRYEVNGATVILDYAHNVVGLTHLLELAARYRTGTGRLIAIIGTAGDRTDEVLREMGRVAATASDLVLVKETHRYLRGRASPAEMNAAFVDGIVAAGDTPYEIIESELGALERALHDLHPGDVIAMMCIEESVAARDLVSGLASPKPA